MSNKRFTKIWNAIVVGDPTAQIGVDRQEIATHPAVRRGGEEHLTRHRFHSFLAWHQLPHPELLTLATTIDTWQPEINTFVTTGTNNACTEGYDRPVKQVNVGCGFRNPDNSARRKRFHFTRIQRAATQTSY